VCTLEASRSDAKMLRMLGVLCGVSVPLSSPGQRGAPPLPEQLVGKLALVPAARTCVT